MFSATNAKNISGKCVNIRVPVPKDAESDFNSVLRRYDGNNDGRLTRKELKAAFKEAGSSMPGWRAIRAMYQADKNRDGFIEAAEYPAVTKYAAKRGYTL